jgi:hypothetical protein
VSSPFAAPLYSKPVQPEVMGKLDQLQIRMQALGATPDEIMAMLESWWRDDDDWGDEDRSRILRSSDVALRAMIDQVRREWDATR